MTKPVYNFIEIFRECVNSKQDESIKVLLLNKEVEISLAVTDYETKMPLFRGDEIQTIFPLPPKDILTEELKKLYSAEKLRKCSGNPYENILAKSKKKGCCYCSYKDSEELDHFLPRGSVIKIV